MVIHYRCRHHSTILQHIPEFIGFLKSLGRKPIKKPRIPDYFQCFIAYTNTGSLNFIKLILLLKNSKGWDTVNATTPAIKAGINVALTSNCLRNKSSFR